MKIKRFHAPTLQDAFKIIKNEMGENALILSSKEIAPPIGVKAKKWFEVTAAVEEFPVEHRASYSGAPGNFTENTDCSRSRPAMFYEKKVDTIKHKEKKSTKKEKNKQKHKNEYLQKEIIQLKKMVYFLSQKMASNIDVPVSSPYFEIYNELLSLEMDPWLAYKLIDEAGPPTNVSPESKLIGLLSKWFSTDPFDNHRQIRAMLLGPTGVGKTTTIAKIAAHHHMGLNRRVLLLTTDTYRIGAADQLKTYSEIIGIPCRTVLDVDQLKKELDTCNDFDTVLVDTTGRSQRNLADLAMWADFTSQRKDLRKCLVLSSTSKMTDLIEIVDNFEIFGTDTLCITKIDESFSLGPIANILYKTKLPVSYVTNGQNVPNDMLIPTDESLAAMILKNKIMEGVV